MGQSACPVREAPSRLAAWIYSASLAPAARSRMQTRPAATTQVRALGFIISHASWGAWLASCSGCGNMHWHAFCGRMQCACVSQFALVAVLHAGAVLDELLHAKSRQADMDAVTTTGHGYACVLLRGKSAAGISVPACCLS